MGKSLTQRVYLDCNATTPLDPRVLESMLPFFSERFGNASSRHHAFGWEARDASETARALVANLVGAAASDVVFTSGATESNHLALLGVTGAARGRRHVVTTAAEHASVESACQRIERMGFEVTRLPVDRAGRVRVAEVARAIRPETALVSVIWANNETGAVNPVVEIAEVCRRAGVLLHSDAVQAAGRIPLEHAAPKVDFLSLGAHKMNGPKGVGALVVGPRVRDSDWERDLRAGTLNVPAAVGFGRAAELARAGFADEATRIRRLRDLLIERIWPGAPDARINGDPAEGLPNTASITFPGVDADALLFSLPDVAASTGSACGSGGSGPSRVLLACGLSEEEARSTVRFSLGRFTTEAEAIFAGERIAEEVRKCRR